MFGCRPRGRRRSAQWQTLRIPLSLLRWPDRLQAKCYIEGFRIVGPIESSHFFKPLPLVADSVPIEAQEGFYGEQAKADL